MSELSDFDGIVAANFDPEDIRIIEEETQAAMASGEDETRDVDGRKTRPYTVEVIEPGRRELLELYNALLMSSLDMQIEKDFPLLAREFANRVQPQLDIRSGQEMLIRGSRSLIGVTDGMFGELDGSEEVIGKFAAFSVEPWYNLPLYGEVSPDLSHYEMPCGLSVLMKDVCLQYVGFEDEVLPGIVSIPLQHGTPELYRVLRPY